MMTDEQFQMVAPILQGLLWASRTERERIQQQGVNVIPTNFYSNTPTIAEILDSFEYRSTEPPYLVNGVFDPPTLERELNELIPFAEGFAPRLEDDETTCRNYFWKNSQFTYSDGMAYYAYLRRLRPRTVVEIGSGFSSMVALEALRQNGFGTLHCIEPFPRPFISSLADEGALQLKASRAQDITAPALNALLDDGDVLFIDSTHTVKTGSDCLHIFLRLLPQINRRIYVHVHDVFLPFGLPQDWLLDTQIYWTEQYLLLALLIDNPRAKVLFGSAYHHHFNRKLLDSLMHGRYESGGGSLWFEYDGRR